MAFGGLSKEFTVKNIIIALIGTFFLIQIVSLLLSQLVPSIPLLKGGNALLLILVAAALITLFVLAIDLKEFKQKENLIFLAVIVAAIIAGFVYLPKYFPQLFVISPDVANSIKQMVGSIIGGGG